MSETALNTLLRVDGLKTHFQVGRGVFSAGQTVKAVDGVDFVVPRGQTLGLVGESGSGKTTVGRSLLKLVPPTAGTVQFDGQDVLAAKGAALKTLRRRMAMIFQDPVSSLNPRMTVGSIVAEPLKVHFSLSRRQRRDRVGELLETVGLSADYISRYPHEFSGGQRQRIGVARALASEPDFIIADEPVSALDVSIQAQILNLLSDLQASMNLSFLFIAHNLAVVEHIADRVAVMYLGRIVEVAGKEQILSGHDGYRALQHPYTEALISAVPVPKTGQRKTRIRLPGEVPSPINAPTGCPFHPRCPLTRQRAGEMDAGQTRVIQTPGESVRVVKRCVEQTPQLKPTANNPSHLHACLLRQD